MTKNETLLSIKRPNLRGIPLTRTSLFMLASVGFDSNQVPMKLLNYYGFINCYLSHKESIESYPDSITMVFNPTNEALEKFWSFYEVYSAYPNFVDDYLVDFNLIVVVFKVKKEWKDSLMYFKESKYSKIPRAYAELLKATDFRTGKTYISDEYKVITKDPEYKKKLEESLSNHVKGYDSSVTISDSQELMSPLDLTKETFCYEYSK